MAKKKTVTGIAEIELKSDRFMPRVREVQQKFQEMTRSGRTALGQLSQHAGDTARNLKAFETQGKDAFRGVGNQATVMGTQLKVSARSMAGTAPQGAGAFRTIGNSAQTAAAQVKMSAGEMNNAKLATVGLMGSVAGLAGSFVTLETSLSNIPKRLNAIAKAESLVETQEVSLQRQNTSLKRLTMQLDKARQDGNKTLEEMEILERKVADTQANIALYTGKLSDAQEDLNLKHMDYADTLKLMATSIFTTFLTAGSTVTIMITQLATEAKLTTGAFVKLKLATIANSRFLRILKFDVATASANFSTMSTNMHVAGSSAQVLQAKLKGVAYGIKGVYAAMGPLGWAIIGITTLYSLWTDNTLGIRDATRETIKALQEMWDYLKWIVPALGAIDIAWQKLDPEGHAAATRDFSEAVNLMGHDMRDVEVAANELGLTLNDLERAAKETGTTVQEVADTFGIKYVSASDKAAGVTKELGLSFETTTSLAHSLGISVEEVEKRAAALMPQTEELADAFVAPPDGLVPAVQAASGAFIGPGGLVPTLGQVGDAFNASDGYIAAAEAAAAATEDFTAAMSGTGPAVHDAFFHVKRMTDEYEAMRKAALAAGEAHISIFSSKEEIIAARNARRGISKKNDIQLSNDVTGRNIYGNALLRGLTRRFDDFGSQSRALRILSEQHGNYQLQKAARGGGPRSVGNRVGGTFRGARRAGSRAGRQGPGPKRGPWRYRSHPGYGTGPGGRPSNTQRARALHAMYRDAPALPHWQEYDKDAVGPDGEPLYITERGPHTARFYERVDKAVLYGMPADVAELLSIGDVYRAAKANSTRSLGSGDRRDHRPHLYKTGVAIRKLFNERFAAETKKVDVLSELVIEYFGGSRNGIRRGLRDGNAAALNEQARRAKEHNGNRERFQQRRALEATLA